MFFKNKQDPSGSDHGQVILVDHADEATPTDKQMHNHLSHHHHNHHHLNNLIHHNKHHQKLENDLNDETKTILPNSATSPSSPQVPNTEILIDTIKKNNKETFFSNTSRKTFKRENELGPALGSTNLPSIRLVTLNTHQKQNNNQNHHHQFEETQTRMDEKDSPASKKSIDRLLTDQNSSNNDELDVLASSGSSIISDSNKTPINLKRREKNKVSLSSKINNFFKHNSPFKEKNAKKIDESKNNDYYGDGGGGDSALIETELNNTNSSSAKLVVNDLIIDNSIIDSEMEAQHEANCIKTKPDPSCCSENSLDRRKSHRLDFSECFDEDQANTGVGDQCLSVSSNRTNIDSSSSLSYDKLNEQLVKYKQMANATNDTLSISDAPITVKDGNAS
jgi:hypothetical protein